MTPCCQTKSSRNTIKVYDSNILVYPDHELQKEDFLNEIHLTLCQCSCLSHKLFFCTQWWEAGTEWVKVLLNPTKIFKVAQVNCDLKVPISLSWHERIYYLSGSGITYSYLVNWILSEEGIRVEKIFMYKLFLIL